MPLNTKDSSQKTTLVVAGIITDKDKILITQRFPNNKFGNQWEFPGGKLDWGETPEDGLKREILEELALNISVKAPIHIINYITDINTAFLVMFYLCSIESGTLTLIGCQDALWVTANEISTIDFLQSNLPVVEILKNRINW